MGNVRWLVWASLVLIGCGGSPAAPEPAEATAGTGTAPTPSSGGKVEGSGGVPSGNPSGSGPTLSSGGGGSTTSPDGGVGSSGGVPAVGGASWMTAFTAPPGGCAVCHGSSGAGLPPLGPEIQHPTRELFDFLVRNGEPHQLAAYAAPMPGFPDTLVSSTDLDSIFDWLQAMPQPTTGQALFADYCSYCHGSDGRGGVVGVAYASAYHSAPFRRKGAAFRDYVRAGHLVDDKGAPVPVSNRHAYMPAFGPALLSDAELTLIENWLPQ